MGKIFNTLYKPLLCVIDYSNQVIVLMAYWEKESDSVCATLLWVISS